MREIRRARAGNGRMEENTRGPDDEAQKRTRKLRTKEEMADDNARGEEEEEEEEVMGDEEGTKYERHASEA